MLVVAKLSADRGTLMNPAASVWRPIEMATLALEGTPTGTQPTPYTRTAWKDRKVGAVSQVAVQAAHDGESIFIRLEWADATENRAVEDNNVFPDGAGVLFPIKETAPINKMGSEDEPVNAWQWQASSERGRSVIAHGVGTTEPTPDTVDVAAVRSSDHWQVILSRKLAGDGESVNLLPGKVSRIGVAVWEGSNGERAGFKGFTPDWTDIRLADV